MGNRYYLTEICPKCGTKEEDVYFAPTCGFTKWECPKCGHKIDLCEETGIFTYEDASNVTVISEIMEHPQAKE